ncbi:uncharacterized protein LOC134266332 [Saccostrea cucullata]|uniref:uncharacterized protein LOC134266332 n=1 Tax=Saccostrea cuccullata TaxID=36930 RepID=UPI002ED00863
MDFYKSITENLGFEDSSPSLTHVTKTLPSHDVTNRHDSPKQNEVDGNVINSLRRVDSQISKELDEWPSSEIFVRHQWEDTPKGDRLGGFLCSTTLTDGTNLHAFRSLNPDGILAKFLHVKYVFDYKQHSIALNDFTSIEHVDLTVKKKIFLLVQILDSPSFSEEDVLELFRTLPIGEPINMVLYTRTTKLLSFIDFQLEATKPAIVTEDIMLKTAYVNLTSSGYFSPTVKALRIPNQSKFLVSDQGRLQCSQVTNFLTNCKCHFIVRKSLNDKTWRFEYRYQVQLDPPKYLGIRGNALDLIAESKEGLTQFQQQERHGLVFLKIPGRNDVTVSFNEDRGIYELRPCDCEAENGINLVHTNCPV